MNIRGNNNVGGLVGYNNGTIMNAYATGDTIANQGSVGGLIDLIMAPLKMALQVARFTDYLMLVA